jgi:hypothetical protein
MTRRPPESSCQFVGSFAHVDLLVSAAVAAKQKNLEILEVFSPVPVEALNDLVVSKRNLIPYVTFVGGILGLLGGLALGIWTAEIWDIIVGGKPVSNHVPFVVIAFEALVLSGALFTFVGLLGFAGLPYRKFPGRAYRPEFSKDRFGLWVGCPEGLAESTEAFLQKEGAVSVERLEPRTREGVGS